MLSSHPLFSLPLLICLSSTHPVPSSLSHSFFHSRSPSTFETLISISPSVSPSRNFVFCLFLLRRVGSIVSLQNGMNHAAVLRHQEFCAGVAGVCVYTQWLLGFFVFFKKTSCCIFEILSFCWFVSLCNCSPFSCSSKYNSAISPFKTSFPEKR